MRSLALISSLVLSLLFISCSSSKKIERTERAALKVQEVQKALEEQRFVVEIDRIRPRRGGVIQLNTSHNYLIINGKKARMNLAYIGKSMDIRRISGINMQGTVTNSTLSSRKNGVLKMQLTLEQGNESFDVDMSISNSGSCTINVYHPRLDPANYRGTLSAVKLR